MESEPGILELKVHDLASERWVMANLPCVCGGHWLSSGAKRLVDVEGRPCDELDATCDACGTSVTFRFDVSAFFGHKAQTEAWIATTLPEADGRTRGRIARKLGSPLMTRITSFILGLTKDGDRVTLLYMHSRIAEALAAMETAEPGAAEPEENGGS
jgi:hypothetical protein